MEISIPSSSDKSLGQAKQLRSDLTKAIEFTEYEAIPYLNEIKRNPK